ncbi:MAG: DHHA1 domain-containing protein [Tissierellia bacterium]|nr:DHHA1 domain-containing protein [Tissierellia bacterium]
MITSKKIYQKNSYLTNLDANVISCNKNNDLYEIILDQTIFYPHMSGGQPKDEGTINNIKVLNVFEKDNEIIHVVSKPLKGKVNLNIEFESRFDHMQQHTGQHILSAYFDKLYNGKTVGFHLSSNYTTIDLNIELNEEMIENVELHANKIIYANKTIKAKTFSQDEVLKQNLRKPPSLELESFRLIKIEDCDLIACGGTHVNNAGEIGIIKIIKAEKYKSGTRVEFLCGKRALLNYMSSYKELVSLSTLLTCRSDMVYDNFIKIKEENRDLKKSISSLQKKINDYIVNELKENAYVKNDVKFIFQELQDTDMKDLRFICSKIIEEKNHIAILFGGTDSSCALCLGQSKNINYNIIELFNNLKEKLDAKGGGNNYLIQGTGTILNKGEECIELAKNMLLK